MATKKKQVVTGWMGKSETEPIETGSTYGSEVAEIFLYTKKGKKEDWIEQDWPPIKVTLTAEWEVPE